MEVLSNLENANILSCLITHAEEFDDDPHTYATFFQAVTPFHGQVTYSTCDTKVDTSMTTHIALGPPASVELPYARLIQNYANTAKAIRAMPAPTTLRSHERKHCHKCHKLGHICCKCPANVHHRAHHQIKQVCFK